MALEGSLSAKMPPISFTSLRTGETHEMPHAPERLEENLTPNWVRQQILGMSHNLLQYSHTDEYKLENLEFFFKGYSEADIAKIHDGRRFLMSLCYPSRSADSVGTGAPPRILFYWPQLISMTCIIDSLRITHEKFAVSGLTMVFRANITFGEIRDVRLTSEEVRSHGTLRSKVASEV